MMRVLVACETSGTVRDAFRARGVAAWSCDILPADPGTNSLYHIEGDLREVFEYGNAGWDLLIAHPPCTYLTSSAEWCYRDVQTKRCTPGVLYGAARRAAREEALDFVRWIMDLPVPRICIENPVGAIGTRIRPADQYIQPWHFGDDASKRTGLWLKGLPTLKIDPAAECPGRLVLHRGKCVERWANQTDSGQNRLAPSANRWQLRSKTYPGIANAMAEQWSK